MSGPEKDKAWRFWVEILSDFLKFPITIIVLFLTILLADWLEIQLPNITTGDISIEWKNEKNADIQAVKVRVNDLEAAFKTLKAENLSPETEANIVQSAETVDDQVAELSRDVSDPNRTLLKNREGATWIGNLESNNLLKRSQLMNDKGEIIKLIELIQENNSYRVDGNNTLREKIPKPNQGYFNAVPSLGVIPRGTRIRALSSPECLTLGSGLTQCWLKVKVLE